MSILILIITSIWAVLLAAAYLSRVSAGLGKRSAATVVTGTYIATSTLILAWFGLNITGLIALFGTALLFAAAIWAALKQFQRVR